MLLSLHCVDYVNECVVARGERAIGLGDLQLMLQVAIDNWIMPSWLPSNRGFDELRPLCRSGGHKVFIWSGSYVIWCKICKIGQIGLYSVQLSHTVYPVLSWSGICIVWGLSEISSCFVIGVRNEWHAHAFVIDPKESIWCSHPGAHEWHQHRAWPLFWRETQWWYLIL